MPPTRTPKAPAFIEELYAFVSGLAEVPWPDLGKALLDGGWLTVLREVAVTPTPSGTTLVSFDLYVGHELAALERFDQITVTLPGNPGPVSIAARLAARESVLYLLTGRLPPAAPPMQPPAVAPVAPQMNGGSEEQHVDMGDADVELPEEDPAKLNLVERTEPDGLPILKDVYAIPESVPSSAVVNAIIEIVERFAATASEEQLTALGVKNPDMMTFLMDFGTAADKETVQSAIRNRRIELAKPVTAAPRRRASAAAN